MQLTTLFLATLSTAAVSAKPGSSWLGSDQVTIMEEYKVPGDNPLYFCADPKDYSVKIDKVDLDPNPPKPGEKLTIKASGDIKEKIEKGFKMHLQVKYGIITLINQEADGCDTIGKADLECPLEKGEKSMSKDVDLPREIPPGTYTVLADVYADDDAKTKITCLTAKIAFHRAAGEGENKDDNAVKLGKVKMGQPRVQMSGPLADMVQERLRRRNEL